MILRNAGLTPLPQSWLTLALNLLRSCAGSTRTSTTAKPRLPLLYRFKRGNISKLGCRPLTCSVAVNRIKTNALSSLDISNFLDNLARADFRTTNEFFCCLIGGVSSSYLTNSLANRLHFGLCSSWNPDDSYQRTKRVYFAIYLFGA